MDHYALFLLKCVLSSGIFYIYYHFALRNKPFHRYNRFYLLATLLLSLLLPFPDLHFFSFHTQAVAPVLPVSPEQVSIHSNPIPARLNRLLLLPAVTISVSLVMLFMLLQKIRWIYQLKKRHWVLPMQGFDLIETNVRQAPFSFFSNLFWRTSIPLHEDHGQKIFLHELTHIRDKHSYDQLFSQVVVCLFWVNPFYWLIHRELTVIHEFIADSKCIPPGDTASFAAMLLVSYDEGSYFNPAHSFFNSSIKRRIRMVKTLTPSKGSFLRKAAALPVLLLAGFLVSFTIAKAQADPKLNPNTAVKPDQVAIHPLNDSVADVLVTYRDAGGHPDTLHLTAAYKKTDSTRTNILYDQESGERKEISLTETEAIVQQILQNPPPEDLYLVDGKEYSPEEVRKLDPSHIKTINIYNRAEAEKRYGKIAKNGAIVLTTK